MTRDQLAHILYNVRRASFARTTLCSTDCSCLEPLAWLLQQLEEDVTPAEAKDIIDDVDDGTGRIDYTLFVKTMLALSGSS